MCNPEQQRGLSLTDLLVGLAIGLLVVLAAIESFAPANALSRIVNDRLSLTQRAEDIFLTLERQIGQAGAIGLVATDTDSDRVVFQVATASAIFSDLRVVGGVPTPYLRTRHAVFGASSHCLGDLNQLPANAANNPRENPVFNDFYLDTGRLMCDPPGTTQPQAIAPGVEDFQVRYGLRTLTTSGPQFRFLARHQVADWASIHAVEICLQLVSESAGHPAMPLDNCAGTTVAPDDGRLRQIFTRVFSVRNALP